MQDHSENLEKATKPPQKKRFNKKFSYLGPFLALINFLLLIATILALIWFYFQFKENQVQNSDQYRQVERNLAQAQMVAVQQQQQLRGFQAKFREFLNLSNTNNQAWKLEEVEYLVNLAAYHLTFENDVPIAVKLLETAKQKITGSNNPKFLPLQQVLSNNIIALNSLPRVDIANLITQLNAISQQVSQLPIIPSQIISPQTKVASSTEQNFSFWRRMWLGITQSFHNLVIIKRQQAQVAPLLPPDQKDNLIQNIQIQLSLAQWAVLHHQPTIYQQSLQKAIDWIRRYFIQDAQATINILKVLTELQSVNIKPAFPDLSDILTAIRHIKSSQSSPPLNGSFIQEPVSS